MNYADGKLTFLQGVEAVVECEGLGDLVEVLSVRMMEQGLVTEHPHYALRCSHGNFSLVKWSHTHRHLYLVQRGHICVLS